MEVSAAGGGMELIAAKLAKNVQEKEGEMALKLIQSTPGAVGSSVSVDPTSSIGQNIDIKV